MSASRFRYARSRRLGPCPRGDHMATTRAEWADGTASARTRRAGRANLGDTRRAVTSGRAVRRPRRRHALRRARPAPRLPGARAGAGRARALRGGVGRLRPRPAHRPLRPRQRRHAQARRMGGSRGRARRAGAGVGAEDGGGADSLL